MNTIQGVLSIKKRAFEIEWRLLVFLILFMDVKLVVKAVAIVLIYLLQPDFRFGFRLKHSRLPLFYLIVIVIAFLNLSLYHNFSENYAMVALTGILIWTACILAVHQIKLFVEKTDLVILHNTLLVFFTLNIAFSLINLFVIFMDIGLRNPFLYQGEYQKYFINTGDYIRGISIDTSTTNALINCFGIIYFLYQKKYPFVLACMATLLLTASNFSNIILALVFIGIFLFKSTKEQKSIIVICVIMMITFLSKISPQNSDYTSETLNDYIFKKQVNIVIPEKNTSIRETDDSLLSPNKRKEKLAILFLDSLARERIKLSKAVINKKEISSIKRPEIPKENINAPDFQWKIDTTLSQRQLYYYIQSKTPNPIINYSEGTPGKILALKQSYNFLKNHQNKIIAGVGIGNFSSKLAFRATGLKISGGFPHQFIYCSPEFLENHLNLYAYFFLKNAHSHSIIHAPASVFDQLLTEYGFIGLTAFLIYYIGFFCRDLKKLSYGLPALALLLAFFLVDYWFEQLSVVVLFELIMFINIKQHTKLPEHA